MNSNRSGEEKSDLALIYYEMFRRLPSFSMPADRESDEAKKSEPQSINIDDRDRIEEEKKYAFKRLIKIKIPKGHVTCCKIQITIQIL